MVSNREYNAIELLSILVIANVFSKDIEDNGQYNNSKTLKSIKFHTILTSNTVKLN